MVEPVPQANWETLAQKHGKGMPDGQSYCSKVSSSCLHPCCPLSLTPDLLAPRPEPEEVVSESTMQRQLLEKKFGTMTEK